MQAQVLLLLVLLIQKRSLIPGKSVSEHKKGNRNLVPMLEHYVIVFAAF